MLAPVHARSNAPRDTVVGSPILLRSQSAWVLKAVAAMKNSGRTVEREKRPSAMTTGHGRRRRGRRLPGKCSTATLVARAMSGLFACQHPDLEDADHEHDTDEEHSGRCGIAHVLVRESLVVDVELG